MLKKITNFISSFVFRYVPYFVIEYASYKFNQTTVESIFLRRRYAGVHILVSETV